MVATLPDVQVKPKKITAGRALRLVVIAAVLAYLPFLLTERAVFGVPLSNGMLLNLGITQINLLLIFMLGAMSLSLLTGSAGLISIGHGAFYAVGAMSAAVVGTQWNLPLPIVLVAAALVGALAGIIAGLPSLRVRGLYFVLSTLAAHHIIVFIFQEYQFAWFDVVGIPYRDPALGPLALNTPIRWYFFLLVVVIAVYWMFSNILSSREGRAMRAMHDHELAATAMGADVRILRLKAFALSSAVASVAGALYAYYMTNATSDSFGINFAIQFIAMIIIGGLGSLSGALFGAAVWLLLPTFITALAANAGDAQGLTRLLLVDNRAQLVQVIFGMMVILLLIFAPGGLPDLTRKLGRVLSPGSRS